MRTFCGLLRLIRPDSTVLIFLSVFLPLAARTGEALASIRSALPALFIAMCTFIVNDIDDVEADKITHPDRPLPSGRLFMSFVTAFYFVCLALALFTIKAFVPNKVAFFYYLLLILVINYKYAAEQLPNCKSAYVACTSSLPIVIVINLLEGAYELYLIATAAFFFVLGRELLMDFLDQAADKRSFIHRMQRKTLTGLAFSSQGVGLVLLLPLIQEPADALAFCFIATLSPISLLLWLAKEKARGAIFMTKLQMFGGLYFLLRN